MSRIYVWIIAVLCVILAGFVGFNRYQINKVHKAEIASLQHELKETRTSIEKERKARVADTRLAHEAAQKAAKLNTEIKSLEEYINTLEDANRECLSGADVERLRQLWKH